MDEWASQIGAPLSASSRLGSIRDKEIDKDFLECFCCFPLSRTGREKVAASCVRRACQESHNEI